MVSSFFLFVCLLSYSSKPSILTATAGAVDQLEMKDTLRSLRPAAGNLSRLTPSPYLVKHYCELEKRTLNLRARVRLAGPVLSIMKPGPDETLLHSAGAKQWVLTPKQTSSHRFTRVSERVP